MKKKIEAGTIVRTAVLVFALINQCLTMAGVNPIPFSTDQVGEFVSTLLTIGAALVAWWKNNSFTQAAITADAEMRKIKGEE